MAKEKISQIVEFNTSASKIYEILTKEDLFGSLSGAPTKIDAKEGGSFSLFGGMITGKNLTLLLGKKIVQDWRVKLWPEGTSSIVTFELTEKSGITTLTMEHVGFPADAKQGLADGWDKNYWEPIKNKIAK